MTLKSLFVNNHIKNSRPAQILIITLITLEISFLLLRNYLLPATPTLRKLQEENHKFKASQLKMHDETLSHKIK